jgi:predicted ribosome quality control (RQC) complex YloA/Tae2 family protein
VSTPAEESEHHARRLPEIGGADRPLAERPATRNPRRVASRGKPYRTLDIDGWEVLVGRSAEDNDHLSLKVARGRDLWLHVGGGTPGSHVVVRNETGGEPPPEVIEKAAQLAAWYSKARGAPRVEVHYCRASNVSKEKGAPAGQVRIKDHKRIKVVPSDLATGGEDD